MTNKQKEISDRIKILCDVKDRIQVGAYTGIPGYKWLNDNWSTSDILDVMYSNKLKNTKETIIYLEQMIHLFGKDI